ncbi:MAG: ATPase [Pelosinus sp.]|nr:ATPase [Pelosinus sp.]
MNVEQLLDEIDNLLLESGRVPLTNKRIVEEDDLARLLDELREAMPSELAEAQMLVKERERILGDAQREAEKIIEQAKVYIAKMTDDNLITKQAQEQANEIIREAHNGARDLQGDAVSYADEVFKSMEAHIEQTLQVVRQGHTELRQMGNNLTKEG